jgi:hypothetical protein
MHLDGFGKTDGLPYQAFDPGTQRGVFAFDLLRMLFPHCMLVQFNVTTIGSPLICVKVREAKQRSLNLSEFVAA